jgi:predicted GIY-YIG superfamily endonuclease
VAWFYILRGSCGRYYIGTENLDRRVAEHRRGKVRLTRRFAQALELIRAKETSSIDSPRELERHEAVNDLNRETFALALIAHGELDLL